MRLHKQFDPENLYCKQAARTALVALIALIIGKTLGLPDPTFLVWSAIFLLQTAVNTTVKREVASIGWATLLSLFAVTTITSLAEFRFFTALFLAIIGGAVVLFSSSGEAAWSIGFHILLLLFLGFETAESTLSLEVSRAVQIAVGALLALLAILLLWPAIPRRLYKRSLYATLRSSCFLYDAAANVVVSNTDDRYLYRFYRRRDEALSLLHRNKEIRSQSQRTPHIGDELDSLYEIIIAISLVRRHLVTRDLLTTLQSIGIHMRKALDFTKTKEREQKEALAAMSRDIAQMDDENKWEMQFLIYHLNLLQKQCESIATLGPL